MSELSHGQQIALSHHLTEYPDDVSFVEVCVMLEDQHDDVTICDAFAMWETEYLIDMMTDLASSIDNVFVDEMEKKHVGERRSGESSVE